MELFMGYDGNRQGYFFWIQIGEFPFCLPLIEDAKALAFGNEINRLIEIKDLNDQLPMTPEVLIIMDKLYNGKSCIEHYRTCQSNLKLLLDNRKD